MFTFRLWTQWDSREKSQQPWVVMTRGYVAIQRCGFSWIDKMSPNDLVQKFSGEKRCATTKCLNVSFVTTIKQRSVQGAVIRTRASECVWGRQINYTVLQASVSTLRTFERLMLLLVTVHQTRKILHWVGLFFFQRSWLMLLLSVRVKDMFLLWIEFFIAACILK